MVPKMDPDIFSLVMKFQNLCKAGRNANMSLSCNNGKVSVQISVDLPTMIPLVKESPTFCYTPTPSTVSSSGRRRRSRNGPARQRRTRRRAEARQLFAEQSALEISIEEQEVLKAAEEAVKEMVDADSDHTDNGVTEDGKDDVLEAVHSDAVLEAVKNDSTLEFMEKDVEQCPSLSDKLSNLIEFSRRKRKLWEKMKNLPPESPIDSLGDLWQRTSTGNGFFGEKLPFSKKIFQIYSSFFFYTFLSSVKKFM